MLQQRMSKPFIFRFVLVALAALGFYAGASLSLAHFNTGETCPFIGPLPACYVVGLGYFLILTAALVTPLPKRHLVFYLGWVPVILLALIGVSLEIIQGETCPAGGLGIPQCFYSLAMAALCWLLFRLWQKTT